MTVPRVNKLNESAEYYFEEGCFIIESWNREEDPDVSIVRARLPAGQATRFHNLVGTIERYVILGGSGEVELGADDPRTVGPGDVVFIPAGCRQRTRNPGQEDLIFLAICSPRFRPDCYRDESS
jgi:mannose-6-phosphate isomerase-like protein (cupin superfamily)